MEDCCLTEENVSIGFLFSLFLKSQKTYFNKILKEDNITIAHVPLLCMLLKYDDFIYQKDLVKTLFIDNALVTRYLRKLEEEKLIERQEDNENRRQNKIKLTPKGRKLAEDIYFIKKDYDQKVIKDVIEKKEIVNIMSAIIKNSKNLIKQQEEEIDTSN